MRAKPILGVITGVLLVGGITTYYLKRYYKVVYHEIKRERAYVEAQGVNTDGMSVRELHTRYVNDYFDR